MLAMLKPPFFGISVSADGATVELFGEFFL
jgi:hypothetical protein